MSKPDTKPNGMVKDLRDRKDLTLLRDKREVQAVKEYFGNPRWFDFKGCFVKVTENGYKEVYCFNDETPRDDTVLYKVFTK